MMDDGVSRLPEFLGDDEKAGSLCNLMGASGPSDGHHQIFDNKTSFFLLHWYR